MANLVNIPAEATTTGVFLTSQSLLTFPVATSVVTMLWKLCGQIDISLEQHREIPIILALLIGAFIYYMSQSAATDKKGKIMEIVTAFLNSMMIAAASLGIMRF